MATTPLCGRRPQSRGAPIRRQPEILSVSANFHVCYSDLLGTDVRPLQSESRIRTHAALDLGSASRQTVAITNTDASTTPSSVPKIPPKGSETLIRSRAPDHSTPVRALNPSIST